MIAILAISGVNPEGWGCHDPQILGYGLWGSLGRRGVSMKYCYLL